MNAICTFDYDIAVTYPDGKVLKDTGEFEISFPETALKEFDEIDMYGELVNVVLDTFHKEVTERGGLLDNPDVTISIRNVTWD
ncbi:MAG: hypothetical protein KBE23_24550 [Chloroflexi bacterium]|nr:hypothetical protein [Chloroflexota bacterium]MBK6709971.1 hypothetical protein [Chloroflexota bacterium]MBK7178732.1 hypothetical protein [Chloroflexota bacterium]MBK8932524.1 hypothetical protein [Chloroflexota bacterium]MBP6805184.1 hypothetical protein [Chloroflexota bacterium]